METRRQNNNKKCTHKHKYPEIVPNPVQYTSGYFKINSMFFLLETINNKNV